MSGQTIRAVDWQAIASTTRVRSHFRIVDFVCPRIDNVLLQ
jgi:hypothetical protein